MSCNYLNAELFLLSLHLCLLPLSVVMLSLSSFVSPSLTCVFSVSFGFFLPPHPLSLSHLLSLSSFLPFHLLPVHLSLVFVPLSASLTHLS